MKVALFGGTGFVGSYLVRELLQHQHQPVLLVRPGSESKVEQREHCVLVPGDIKDLAAIRQTLTGCDAAIYSIGILREFKSRGITFDELQYQGAARTIDAAVELGVQRFILMSANGVKAEGTPYQTSKYQAEQHLQNTQLDWTIFRPSVIFGDPRGKMEFCTQLQAQLIKPPIPAPLFYPGLLPFNAGGFELAPVHIEDVATVFVKSPSLPETIHQTYGLCGPDVLSWKAIIERLGQASGKRKWTVPAPALAIKPLAALLEGFEFFPITQGQITMLMEGNTCAIPTPFSVFGVTPTPFDEAALAYLKRS
ncbi:MAG: NAD(P)H-binding protein [Candidatus Competibacteraceae bacterium]